MQLIYMKMAKILPIWLKRSQNSHSGLDYILHFQSPRMLFFFHQIKTERVKGRHKSIQSSLLTKHHQCGTRYATCRSIDLCNCFPKTVKLEIPRNGICKFSLIPWRKTGSTDRAMSKTTSLPWLHLLKSLSGSCSPKD